MKNTINIIGIGIIILVAAILMVGGTGNSTPNITGNVVSSPIGSNQNVQIVKLSVEGSKYVMNPSEVKKGVPVRIEADMTKMPGCSKSIVIPSFNVRKNFNDKDNKIEFTPDKAGTFNIACSMNMYTGTFTVLDDDGTKANYVEQAPSEASGCGIATGGSGGCGCGG